MTFYIFKNEEPVYWSDDALSLLSQDVVFEDDTILQLGNGWYWINKITKGDVTIVGFLQIKREFLYSNQYLKNAFQSSFNLNKDVDLSLDKKIGNPVIINKNPVFYLDYTSVEDRSPLLIKVITVLFYIISLIFIFVYLTALSGYYDRRRRLPINTFIAIGIIVLLRIIMLYFQAPSIWYSTVLFGPSLYASSVFFPSFGDLLLNTVLIFVFTIILYFRIRPKRRIKVTLKRRFLYITLISLPIYLLSFCALWLIQGIILNSTISYDVNNLFTLDIYSVSGIFIIILIFSSLFLVIKKSYDLVLFFTKSIKEIGFSWLIGLLIVSTIICHFGWIYVSAGAFLLLIVFLLWIMSNLNKDVFGFSQIMIFGILFSLFSTYVIFRNNIIKEREQRKSLALSLSVKQDPIAEFAFLDLEKKIVKDSTVINTLSVPYFDEQRLKDYLVWEYFSDYWGKYDVQITVCRSADSLYIRPDNEQRSCYSFFNGIVHDLGKATVSCNLYFIDKGNGRSSYISILDFQNDENVYLKNTRLFLEFDAKFVPKGLGYPELLLDERVFGTTDLSDYSFARYNKKELVSQFGKYMYSLNISYYGKQDKEYKFFNSNDYSHLYFKADDQTELLISRKSMGLLGFVTPFSYLLVLFTCIVLIFLIVQVLYKKRSIFRFNFQSRIRFSMIFIVMVSLILIGVISIYYILNIYNKKNEENIKEKTQSVIIELESKIASQADFNAFSSPYIQDLLMKFSNVFFTDINLYDLSGNLVGSSRMKIFDEGLIGKRMDPIAFSKLSTEKQTMFVHDEKIGDLEYISAYAPFRNSQNEIIAYINLPYFAKYNELKKELSAFIVAITNIYILLFALAIITAFLISGYVAKRLVLIKEKIAHLKLGKRNEIIVWSADDEIGKLIQEYNRMVGELDYSANLLAKSERESAWREMAKQVAHEIKNPLTPMKLNVQYLEKAWIDKKEDWDERLKKFSKIMVEQIDTLSNIATAFSDFAKMPTVSLVKTDLRELLLNSVLLFNSHEVEVNCNLHEAKESFVMLDPKQMTQVMTNIVKNAIQAIPEGKKGVVEVGLEIDEKWFVVSVKDNGTGVPEDQREKIFMPSFTTKTSGMGLGLAMVKNIIESFDGYIRFETKENVGTTFYLYLPMS